VGGKKSIIMKHSGDSVIGLKNKAAQPPKSKQNLETLTIEDLNGLREKGFKGKHLLLSFVQ